MENFIILTSIGKAVAKDSFVSDEFSYCGVKYENLLLWDQFEKLLNLHRTTGFFLQNTFVNGGRYLALCYSLNSSDNHFSKAIKAQREFVISSFFEPVDSKQHNDDDTNALLTLDSFYARIKQEHESDDLSKVPQKVQHPGLKEETRLRPYQQRGIKWLLKRELELQELPSGYIEMRSKFNAEQTMYYNPSTTDFVKSRPEGLHYPSGGLLCDEMGLGKTVEMITLILMNPRPKSGQKRKADDIEDIPLKTIKTLTNFKKCLVKCICHQEKRKRDKEDLIICSMCFHAQHKKCVGKVEDIYTYMCPICYKSSNHIVESQTTLIVSPTSIKRQWMSEIQRHVQDKNFKTLMYNGIGAGWISPDELAKYDIVITDFATLSRELYFAETIDRELRQTKKFEYPPSPLIHIKFWRVILDEAQMVENANTRPAQMVQTLPAIHRWGCTGTPIEKGSIRHLYGLIFFLGIYPYTIFENFDGLWTDYRNGKTEGLIQFLSKIMWRTCKKDVESEIDIPPQQEVIHYVEMTDLQKCFYQQVHQTTRPEFQKHIFNYISYYDREKKQRVPDYTIKDKALYELNNATLKTLLEPLRMLRQDCTIANLFTHTNDQTRVKQTLHADQLHDHLVKKTTIECKSALRTICSSLNGIAALKIAKEKNDEAVTLYKHVLRLAKDYNVANGVHVDSMLQIHSYSSLIELAVITQNEEEMANKNEYTNEMMTLEWKYIRNYYDKVQNINAEIDACKDEFKKVAKDYKDRDGNWWRDIISVSRTHDEESRLIELINVEFFSISGAGFAEQVRSTHGIQLIITEWTDKIERFSKDVMKRFKNFDYIVKYLKPSNELSDEINEKINRLSKAALECHLNLFEEDQDEPMPKNPANLCELCKLKHKLDEYECVLFNKALVNDIVAGSWNPRFEERLLKVIFNCAKRANFDEEEIEMGKNFFKYLEALKKHYKMLAQLWVELNFTVSAYDELNMCKTRMQVVDSVDEITEEDARFRLKITKYEVQDQIEIFTSQKQEADLLFARLNGRLKYLDHLKEKNEIPVCPICTVQAKDRYYVTVCGHSVCAECFLKLTKDKRRFSNYERLKINCPVCRTTQEIGNILAVTCNAQLVNNEQILGSYSPKIDEIIRCVLRLRREEPNVKILIFSQWDSILMAIITGLKENNISYRASFSSNFSKQIEEFKDFTLGVTCMMLNLKFAGKGLNLTEATHAFLVEPILNADEEMQAIGRIHRIGQTRETIVHKFITKGTIEETLYNKIIQEKDKWIHKQFTIRDLESLFEVEQGNAGVDLMETF